MKKRRGKQPVKPDIEEALKERLVYLKGMQGSTMNIPIIYRRTFDWTGDSVVFKPINKRSFVVYRSDLADEEIDQDNYLVRELDVMDLPWYGENRSCVEKPDRVSTEELREALISISLVDRYIHVDVKKTGDPELDRCLRGDLEHLSTELGYAYSITKDAYRCTFIFPKHSNTQMVVKAVNATMGSIEAFEEFIDETMDLNVKTMAPRMEEVGYMVERSEVNLDQIYTNALNVHWDLPQTEKVGNFLLTQSCERAHDEMEYIVNASKEALGHLELCPGDASTILFEELVSLWRTSVGRSVQKLKESLEAMNLERKGSIRTCLGMIRDYRDEKLKRSSSQDIVITQLTQKIEGLATSNAKRGGLKLLANAECLSVIEILFGINQSASRIGSLANVIATKTLYLRMTEKK
ncbi:MAG: hypothetical protein ACMUHB_00530 [Thermoplasmatota archaeon]